LGSKVIGVTSLTLRGHATIGIPIGHFLLVVLWNQILVCINQQTSYLSNLISLTVSEIFNGECDAMVDMTLNDP